MLHLALILVLAACPALAGTIRIGEGEEFPTVSAALQARAVGAGDLLRLAPGRHGTVTLDGAKVVGRFGGPVTVEGEPGTELSALRIEGGRAWIVRDLTLRPDGEATGPYLATGPETAGVILRRISVEGAPEGTAWTAQDWRRARTGLRLDGEDHVVDEARIARVDHGVEALGSGIVLRRVTVQGFAGDGMRVLGDGSVVEDSRISDCVDVDGNHDDGIQSWSVGPDGPGTGVVRGLTLRRNVILERETPDPLACTLQGIGLFDGMFDDLTVDSNLVVVRHPHGITVMGARRARIAGNTVLPADGARMGPPWVTITAHKDGRPSDGAIVGNLAGSLNFDGFDAETRRTDPTRVRLSGNVILPDPWSALEAGFAPRAGGPAHDSGGWDAAPLDLRRRPRVGPPDAGAVERRDP